MNISIKTLLAASALALTVGVANAQDLSPLNSDSEPDRMDWSELEAKFGAFPAVPDGTRVGGVSKTLTNEYWRSLGEGYANTPLKPRVSSLFTKLRRTKVTSWVSFPSQRH